MVVELESFGNLTKFTCNKISYCVCNCTVMNFSTLPEIVILLGQVESHPLDWAHGDSGKIISCR